MWRWERRWGKEFLTGVNGGKGGRRRVDGGVRSRAKMKWRARSRARAGARVTARAGIQNAPRGLVHEVDRRLCPFCVSSLVQHGLTDLAQRDILRNPECSCLRRNLGIGLHPYESRKTSQASGS